MKVLIVLKEFLLNFPEESATLNEKTIRNWFDGSKFKLIFSSKIKYELSSIVKNSFALDDDGFSFKLDWVKIKKFYETDKEFLKKIDHLPKRAR
jgi:hypothetical protein